MLHPSTSTSKHVQSVTTCAPEYELPQASSLAKAFTDGVFPSAIRRRLSCRSTTCSRPTQRRQADEASGSVQLPTMHLQSTTTTAPPFETDEAERHGRAPLMFQLCYTTSWTPTRPWMTPTPTSTPPPPSCMENVKRRPKTTIASAESEVLQQANLVEVINRKLFEAPETRRPHRPSRICPAAGYGAHIHIRELVFVFSKI